MEAYNFGGTFDLITTDYTEEFHTKVLTTIMIDHTGFTTMSRSGKWGEPPK